MVDNPAEKVNILFIMNGAKPPRGGEYLTFNLITHLNKKRFRPILAYAYDGAMVKDIKKKGIEAVHFPLDDNVTGIYPREINLINPFFIFSFFWRLFLSRNIFKIARFAKKNDIRLIYCADNLSKMIGGIVGKMIKLNVVAHCHDDFKEDTLGKTMRFFYLLLLDRIIAVSEKVRRFFLINGKVSSKVSVIYNGIDAVVFRPDGTDGSLRKELKLNDDGIVIASIGAIEKDKGQRYLFEAIKKLKLKGFSNITCIVCGQGPQEQNLKDFAESEGLTKNVLFLGSREDIPRILKAVDMLVIASLTIESFSMAAVEAMAMEVPVIATSTGGLPEVVDHDINGIIVPPGDALKLSMAIEYLIKNPQIRLEMGKKGRVKAMQHFTIEHNARKTEELFLDLLRSK